MGAGMYFCDNPNDTKLKAHNHGYMIKALVYLGNEKRYPFGGSDKSVTHTGLLMKDFDSVFVERNTGKEYVVYNYDQAKPVQCWKC